MEIFCQIVADKVLVWLWSGAEGLVLLLLHRHFRVALGSEMLAAERPIKMFQSYEYL